MMICSNHHETIKLYCFFLTPLNTHTCTSEVHRGREHDPDGDGCQGQGRRVGGGVKGRILRRLRKEFTGVVQGVSGKKRFLVRFQNGFEKDMTSNQPTVVVV